MIEAFVFWLEHYSILFPVHGMMIKHFKCIQCFHILNHLIQKSEKEVVILYDIKY